MSGEDSGAASVEQGMATNTDALNYEMAQKFFARGDVEAGTAVVNAVVAIRHAAADAEEAAKAAAKALASAQEKDAAIIAALCALAKGLP